MDRQFMDTGVFRSLLPWEGDEYCAHLERLSREDLNRRFHGSVAHEVIEAFARKPFRHDRFIKGWFKDGVLRGAGELTFRGKDAEFSVSVEAPYRGHGIAKELLNLAILRSKALGVERLHIYTHSNNQPMLKVARAGEAKIMRDHGEAEGIIAIEEDRTAIIFDLLREERGWGRALRDSVTRHTAEAWRAVFKGFLRESSH